MLVIGLGLEKIGKIDDTFFEGIGSYLIGFVVLSTIVVGITFAIVILCIAVMVGILLTKGLFELANV